MKLQLVENFAANIALGLRNYDHISEGLKFLGCFEFKFNNCAIMYVIIAWFVPRDSELWRNNHLDVTIVA